MDQSLACGRPGRHDAPADATGRPAWPASPSTRRRQTPLRLARHLGKSARVVITALSHPTLAGPDVQQSVARQLLGWPGGHLPARLSVGPRPRQGVLKAVRSFLDLAAHSIRCWSAMLEVRACSSTIDASLPGAQKRPDQIGDHVGLLVESEVAGVERVHLGVRLNSSVHRSGS